MRRIGEIELTDQVINGAQLAVRAGEVVPVLIIVWELAHQCVLNSQRPLESRFGVVVPASLDVEVAHGVVGVRQVALVRVVLRVVIGQAAVKGQGLLV